MSLQHVNVPGDHSECGPDCAITGDACCGGFFGGTCPMCTAPIYPCYVNVYLDDREYGGPEEGGWWYDTSRIRRVVPTTREHAEELKKRLELEFSNEGRRSDIGSVLSEGRYRVAIEPSYGQTTPETRPRYE